MIVTSLKHGELVFRRLFKNPWCCLDTETKAKAAWAGQKDATLIHGRHTIKMWSACYRGESYSFGTDAQNPAWPHASKWAELFRRIWEELRLKGIPLPLIVMHNGNYDIRVFDDSMFPTFEEIWDTMISSWLANGNEDKGLKARAPFYGRYIRDTATINFNDINELANYAETDVVVTDEIFQMHTFDKVVRSRVLTFINEHGKLVTKPNSDVTEFELTLASEKMTEFDRLFIKYQELQVLKATIRCEKTGVPFDHAHLVKVVRPAMQTDLDEIKKRIFRHAGKTFNLNASAQKVAVLQGLGVKLIKQTKGGGMSADFEALLSVKGQHPIVADMMDYAKVAKLEGTYIGPDGFEHYINPKTRRIHPNLNTVGAVTGRFSSSNPNLQNVPARNDKYKMRMCFRAPKGRTLVCLDFSQIELRVMAMLSKDPLMCKVLNDPKGDIHTETSTNLSVPRDPVAKQCNFLLIFGGGGFALAHRLKLEGHNMTAEEGDEIKANFDRVYHGVPQFRENAFAFHRANGFIPLLTGRRRVIEDIDSLNKWKRHKAETQLANNVVQGSAQDLMKSVIVRCDPDCLNVDRILPTKIDMGREHRLILADYAVKVEKYRHLFRLAKNKWCLQVHDEVLFECDESAAPEVGAAIADIMTWRPMWEPVYDWCVVVKGDGGWGSTWSEAKKPKDDFHKIESNAFGTKHEPTKVTPRVLPKCRITIRPKQVVPIVPKGTTAPLRLRIGGNTSSRAVIKAKI